MSDNLTDRIAQVCRQYMYSAYWDDAEPLAAAIVAELGMRQEWTGRIGVTDHWRVVGEKWFAGEVADE